MDDVLLTIALGNLTLSVGEVASNNHDLIIHSDGERSNVVLLSELLGERSRHSDASLVGGSIEMSLSLLSRLGADVGIEFHLENNLKEGKIIDYGIKINQDEKNRSNFFTSSF